MGRQAQDDYYKDEEAVALAYADAVNAEIKDLFAAGADVVQIDEPWMQQHPDKARRYGLKALDRALDGITGTVAVHLCFGYAAVVHDKPSGYSFLPELEGSKAQQMSIEAAQPKLDLAVLKELPSKTIILGVIDLSDMTIETPQTVADRIRRALRQVPADRLVMAPDCGMKYLPRAVAFGKMAAMAEGAAMVRRGTEWCVISVVRRSSGLFAAAIVALALLLMPSAPVTAEDSTNGMYAELPGVKLWFTDSGGAGTPIVLLHSNTGNSDIWAPQIAAFSKAGYRVHRVRSQRLGQKHGEPGVGPAAGEHRGRPRYAR